MHKSILRIALPSIVTNITVPLLGIVDLSIVGHFDSSFVLIGAISVGTLIFNMVYWLFNFLRMGSSGLTAQAFGRKDYGGQQRILHMALTVALCCGLLIFALQRPIEWVAQWIIAPSSEVWTLAVAYFRIRIWAAPAVLALFAMTGWLVGMQNSRYPMYIAIGQNLVNISLSYLLAIRAGMGIEGVALGTVIAQYLGLAAALWLCKHQLSTQLSTLRVDKGLANSCEQQIVDKKGENHASYQQPAVHIEWKTFFVINRDIFFRMVFLIAVTTAFTAYGARMGDMLLAVNTLLMQLFTLFSYFSDGFALAGEALVGKAVGNEMRNEDLDSSLIRLLFRWGLGVALLFTLLYAFGGTAILRLFTDDNAVLTAASPYMPWAVAIPLCGIAAFMWDGIYIGATRTRHMFLSLLISAIIFFSVFEGGTLLINSTLACAQDLGFEVIRLSGCEAFIPNPSFNSATALLNHLLWFSFLLYLTTRGIVLSRLWRRGR